MTYVGGVLRGAAAGAAGVTALNAATYLDMLLRARPASEAPQKLVETVADDAGVDIPGGEEERQNRLQALGPLAGLLTGVAVGAVAGGLRAAGVRLPTAVAGPLLGLAAMVSADLPLATTGVSNPRTWSAPDWAADALPHLAYGLVTHTVLVATD
ncbi:MAG: hypothetical protein ABJA74_16925 [Lapillicoccus sp.]